jgi:hypothetical protein
VTKKEKELSLTSCLSKNNNSKYLKLKICALIFNLIGYAYGLSAADLPSYSSGVKNCNLCMQMKYDSTMEDSQPTPKAGQKISSSDTTKQHHTPSAPVILVRKPVLLRPMFYDTTKLVSITSKSKEKGLGQLIIKNNFTKNLLGYFIISQRTSLVQSGVKSTSYFSQFEGKRIIDVRFFRLNPFGTSMTDTTLVPQKWIDRTGNRLHMNTTKSKLRMQLLFKTGDLVNPILMAENEKLMRDLNYLEDVSIILEPVDNNTEEVKVVVITKDKFEYAVNMNLSPNNSDVEIINENIFGLGHRLNLGMAQQNAYLPQMGLYFSYHINNILGRFINSTFGYSDTYLKKGWNISAEREFLTSKEENAGGFSFENISKYNRISENHPITLDSAIAYSSDDFWFLHSFQNVRYPRNKTTISLRYYHQKINLTNGASFGQSQFYRNHEFLITGLSFSKRYLYKNNQIYGYGVTEDIPYGHYYEIAAGLDKSQYGIWHYLSLSLSNAFIDMKGRYYSGRLAIDGFLDNGVIKQGTILASTNFFSNKFYAFGDPFRTFLKIEFLGGINRFNEEYLTINGQYGIRDFYTSELRGRNRLKFNFETVRYLKLNFYNFKFTNYLFTDFAFLSDSPNTLFKNDFYVGIGAGLRIYNESLVFKIVDIRLTWFPLTPPEGISPIGTNLQGLTKSRFDDFLGRKPEVIRYQ